MEREAKKLTQAELASLIYRESFQTISNIEHNRTKLTRENAVKIAEICGCTPEYLLCESKNRHYTGDVVVAITDMQRYANMLDTFVEYVTKSVGMKNKLGKEETSILVEDVLWYARVRLMKMTEGEKGNG